MGKVSILIRNGNDEELYQRRAMIQPIVEDLCARKKWTVSMAEEESNALDVNVPHVKSDSVAIEIVTKACVKGMNDLMKYIAVIPYYGKQSRDVEMPRFTPVRTMPAILMHVVPQAALLPKRSKIDAA